MSLDAMKQALRAAEFADLCIKELVTGSTNREVAKQVLSEAITALRAAIDQAQPDARVHHKMMIAMIKEHWRSIDLQWKDDPELCHALGYEAGYKDAVARRVEPRFGGSGAGFESLPASPNQPEKNT